MAEEINIQLDPFANTGLTLLGKIFNKAGTQQGSTVSLTENAPALYSGDFDLSSTSDGAYAVRFETNTPDKLYGTGTLFVRNNAEVSQENFFNPSLDEVTTDTASRDASKADVSGLSTFDPSTDTVTTDTASRDASKADVSGLATQTSVDDIPSDVDTVLTASHGSGTWQQGTGGDTAADIYTYFTAGTREDAFKADVSGLSTFDPSSDTVTTDTASRDASKADVSGLSTFDPTTDEVTTDAASRNASKADVSGLATQSSVDNIPADVDTELTSSHGSGSWQQGSSGTVDANVISVDGNSVSSADDFKADVSGLSTFDPSTDQVTTDSASREASKADVSDLGTKANQNVINEGVKKASRIKQHVQNLPD